MRVLVWQWGRFGAGPRVAVELAQGLRVAGADSVVLSLAEGAEILTHAAPIRCELTVPTYDTPLGFGYRLLTTPVWRRALAEKVGAWAPDVAVCAMPGLLDLAMADVLARGRIPFAVMVHDADLHPGDGIPLQMRVQRRLMARADALVTLSRHVEQRVREQVGPARTLLRARLPPFDFGPVPPPSMRPGPLRLLSFGRLLPYKGLDLLAEALARLPDAELAVRVVGQGPESETLARLRALRSVSVENRWVPEHEIAALLAWSDAVILPYREASQSGVAAAAISARRRVIATRVGGLAEQFRGEALALMCEPEPASIASAITRLLDEPAIDPAASVPLPGWQPAADGLLAQLSQAFGPFRSSRAGIRSSLAWPRRRATA